MATLPSARLFKAAAKLQEARDEIAEAERELKGTDDQPDLELLHEELADLNWRTQSLAMKRQRHEQKEGQYKGPLTPASDFPDYDASALAEAKTLVADEEKDLADQEAFLPPEPKAPDTDRRGVLRRAFDALKRVLFRQKADADD